MNHRSPIPYRPPRRGLPLVFLLVALLSPFPAPAGGDGVPQVVVGGPGNDYQIAVVQPWQEPQRRLAVFERLDAWGWGDLWSSHSQDGGATWSTPEPVAVAASAGNERHPSLVQTGPNRFLLAYLHGTGATGSFHIHLAEAGSDLQFSALGAAALGWSSGGQVNPQLLRLPDGRLLLAYQNLAAAHAGAYLAVSDDDGHSWDLARTRLSPGPAALPRLAYRPADGRLLALYQTGSNPVTIWARSSDDPLAWTTPPQALASGVNDHDPWPVLMADGRFVALWSRAIGDAFQLHAAHSADGRGWSTPTALHPRPGLHNIQAHVPAGHPGRHGRLELYWGAAQTPGHNDYDLWRLPAVLAVEALFADGFEAAAGGD